jgi:hypothetical protein
MQTQSNLFGLAPLSLEEKRERRKSAEREDAQRRQSIIDKAFEHQMEIFKERFESFLVRFLDTHKGETVVFPTITDAYARRKDLPQPRLDFRCVGFLAQKYKKLGRIRKIKTVPDKVSGRDIPLYEIL